MQKQYFCSIKFQDLRVESINKSVSLLISIIHRRKSDSARGCIYREYKTNTNARLNPSDQHRSLIKIERGKDRRPTVKRRRRAYHVSCEPIFVTSSYRWWRSVCRARAEASPRMSAGTGPLRALLTSDPPRPPPPPPQRAQSAPSPIQSPGFDLFYVMPATPESISPGTLLFCVCMRNVYA